MSDSDKTLKILIELGVIGQDDLEKANQILTKSAGHTEDFGGTLGKLQDKMAGVPESFQNVTKSVDRESEALVGGREKHEALYHVASQLDQVLPGLGEGVRMMGGAMMEAARNAEEGSTALDAVGASMGALLAEVAPLLAVVLAVEAATKLWENYGKAAEAAAKAQEEAAKSMDESTQKSIDKLKELDEILHPKKSEAQIAQEALDKKIEGLKAEADAQKEIARAHEKAELATASPEQSIAIRQRYSEMEAQNDLQLQKQIQAAQTAAASDAQAKIAALDKEIETKKANLDEGNQNLLDEYNSSAWLGSGKTRADVERGIAGRNAAFASWAQSQRNQIGDIGEFAAKSAASAGATGANISRQTSVQNEVQGSDAFAAQAARLMQTQTGTHETLRQLFEASNKSNETVQRILSEIIAGHLSLATEVQSLRSQLAAHQQLAGA